MSSKNTFPPPRIDIKTPFSYKNSLYNGCLMALAIPIVTYGVEHCFGKKYYINVNTSQFATLVGLIIASRFGIDYIKREKLITKEW